MKRFTYSCIILVGGKKEAYHSAKRSGNMFAETKQYVP